MGMIPLSDEVQRLVEREVAAGRASTPTAFVEAAVLRLTEEAQRQDEEMAEVAAEGIADIEAGRYVTIASEAEMRRLFDGMLERVRARRAAEG
jgi:predicted transcriptional regulator